MSKKYFSEFFIALINYVLLFCDVEDVHNSEFLDPKIAEAKIGKVVYRYSILLYLLSPLTMLFILVTNSII